MNAAVVKALGSLNRVEYQVGDRVRVRLNLDGCKQAGKLHGWAIEGRTGTVRWLEEGRPDNHIYAVGYFWPPVVLPDFLNGFSPQFHSWFAPWEIEEVGP